MLQQPPATSLDDMIEGVLNTLGLTEESTYADMDAAFFARVDLFDTSPAIKERIKSAWLKATDHEEPSKFEPMTRVEGVLLIEALKRIARAN